MLDLLVSGLARVEISLPQETVTRQVRFLDELLRWNQRVNLTSICDRSAAVEKHLLDSLILLKYLPVAGRLLDMGSGGGLPGIPLAIARRDLQVTSVDSVGKKIHFQRHIKRLLTLDNLTPVHARVEALESPSDNHGQFDFVVARALSTFESLVSLSAPRLKDGGMLLVMKGPEGRVEYENYSTNHKVGPYGFKGLYSYRLPNSRSERQLIILRKKSRS